MHIFISIVHIIVCVMMILVVLLQAGKGASMGSAFGGGSSQTVFGSGGPATFLGKATTVVATIFMLTALSLSYFSVHKLPSLMEKATPQAQQQTRQQGAPPAADQTTGAPAQKPPAAPQK